MDKEPPAPQMTSSSAVRCASRVGEPTAALLEELLEELGASGAGFVFVCYSEGADDEALARLLDQRTGARGVGALGIPEASAGMTGIALHGVGMHAAVEVLPQLDQLSLQALDTVPGRLCRTLGRVQRALEPGHHAWLTLFDAQTRREPLLTPLISRWGQLELAGGSLANPLTRCGCLLYHGRVWRGAAAVILLESALPIRAIQHTHMELTSRWMTVTRTSADGRIIEELDNIPAAIRYAEALGLGPEELTLERAARHPFGLRFRGRAFPITSVRITEQRQLSTGVAVPEGERLNVLEPVGLMDKIDALMPLAQTQDQSMLLFDCVSRLAEANALGRGEEYMATLHRAPSCVINSYGEQFGYMHLNCSLTGLVFGGHGARTSAETR
jgi:hypothetical protein